MTPEKLASLLTTLEAAADLVEAIDQPELQRHRGWDLASWDYELVPWGVRFRYDGGIGQEPAEILARLHLRMHREGENHSPATVLLMS